MTRLRTVAWLALVFLPFVHSASQANEPLAEFQFRPVIASNLAPATRATAATDIALLLDDDVAEAAFGITGGLSARQFLWFNRFTPAVDVNLTEIHVLFPSDPGIAVGDPIQLVVYRDADSDPTNGAELLVAQDATVQVADDVTFSVYALASPLELRGPGDLLVGVVNRYVQSGVSAPSQPAALDTTDSASRSWIATWIGDPPAPPVLPSNQSQFLVDDVVAGNWMIRAYGTRASSAISNVPSRIPSLGDLGITVLMLLLAMAAIRSGRQQ